MFTFFYVGYFEKVEGFFKIACAIINAFSVPLCKNTAAKCKIADKALELVDQQNLMQQRVEEEGLNRRTKSWKVVSASDFPDFPIIPKEELQGITLGMYQLGLADQYAQLHMKESDDFQIVVNSEVSGVVRAKIESRFAANATHDLWISYDDELNGMDAIKGYYCCCKQGARTVGCCAHVSCV